jgi:predicted amidohydrolase YtcJ
MSQPPEWRSKRRVLMFNGTIHSPASPFATAMLVDGDEIAWLGEDSAADSHHDAADEIVDLRGALVTPGFVDSHVHATSTGITLGGLDLSRTNSLAEALSLIEAAARLAKGGTLLGHGWDETRWPEGRPPTSQEVDRASWGSVVYLSRIDVHSAVASGALLAQIPDIRTLDGWSDTGVVSKHAHHAVRAVALRTIGAAQTESAHRNTRAHAASLGVVALQEMSGPAISGEDDLRALLAQSAAVPGPLVAGYWGELASAGGVERAMDLGAIGAGGDLFIDGAIGSRTACLRHDYLDVPSTNALASTHGAQYLSAEDAFAHIEACVRAGIQSGFHVIGDAATDIIMSAFTRAAAEFGVEVLRSGGHRLEHAEMLDDAHIAEMAHLGMTASVQPMFNALWGDAEGMYEQRLGAARAHTMNRFADMNRAGVLVAFGSDSPVTELGPWQAVRAAMFHHQPAQRMTARAAFGAHTRGGWRAIGETGTGAIAPGAPAHYAIWDAPSVVVQTPDDRLTAWSTDPRSGTPGLPGLSPDLPLPAALRTVVAGATVFDNGFLE